MTQHTRPTVAAFKRYARTELTALVHAMLAARVFAEKERARVNAYTAPIFAEFTFAVNPEFAARDSSIVIDKPENLYLCDMGSPEYAEYNRRVVAANIENGWTGNPDHCPALVAQTASTRAEYDVLKSLGRFMGADFTRAYGEKREQALVLAVSSCLAD